jgi:ABC-2 type transport system permease protein
MRKDRVYLVFRKDFIEISRSKEVLLPMIIIPLIFALLLPALSVISPEDINVPGGSDGLLENIISRLPKNIQNKILELTITQQYIYVMLVYFFAPFFLIIPVMSSSVIAADSFAGEKERNTIEALMATPLTDSELLLGKILVSFIPSMGVTIFGFILYTITVDLLTHQIFGMYIMPTIPWILMILLLSPILSLLAIGATVIISSRVKGFREAQQVSALLVIPILALLFGQASGFLIMGSSMMILMSLLLGLVDIVVFKVGLRLFQRDKILSQSR